MSLKLTYFAIPARAETARLILTLGKLNFEDKRVAFDDWKGLKATAPFGQLPILEHDGKVLAQSEAIEHYTAKLAGLYPTDPWEAALAHQWYKLIDEVTEAYFSTMRIESAEEKIKKRQDLTESSARPKLKLIDEQLSKGEYLLGDKISYADVRLFHSLCLLRSGMLDGVPTSLVDEYPSLKSFRNRFAKLAPIKEFYEKNTDGIRPAYKPDA